MPARVECSAASGSRSLGGPTPLFLACCSENASRHGRPGLGRCAGGLLENDLMAEALELADRPLGALLDLVAFEEVGAEIGVELAAREQCVDDLQLRVGDGDDGSLVAAATADSPVFGLQVTVLAGCPE